MSQDSAVGIETGYVLDGRGVGIRVSTYSRPILKPTEPPFNGYGEGPSHRVKQPVSEAHYSLPTSADFKNTWIHMHPLLHKSLRCSAQVDKHRDNFTV
jgi:hypothetical protein